MRVVLDTNVIVAAFAARGLCTEVFEVCLEGHEIVISEHILSEINKKLEQKIRLPQGIIRNIIQYLRNAAEIVKPEDVDKSACRDPDDIRIIGTALGGNADFIITGDNDLLILKKYRRIKIINPREFWSLLKDRHK